MDRASPVIFAGIGFFGSLVVSLGMGFSTPVTIGIGLIATVAAAAVGYFFDATFHRILKPLVMKADGGKESWITMMGPLGLLALILFIASFFVHGQGKEMMRTGASICFVVGMLNVLAKGVGQGIKWLAAKFSKPETE